jgi:exoribonuclease-2
MRESVMRSPCDDFEVLCTNLKYLYTLAQLRMQYRREQGAIFIRSHEVDIRVDADTILLHEIHENEARELVSEFMILAGEISGLFAQEKQFPLPFRYQESPCFNETEQLALPEGLVRDYAKRRQMPRGRIGVEPAPHASLGIKAYVQVTSPLRRYTDLLAHRQIKNYIRNLILGQTQDLAIAKDELEGVLSQISPIIQDSNRAAQETLRYWQLEYLRRNQGGEPWETLVLQASSENEIPAVILFLKIGMEWNYKPARLLHPGEILFLYVKSIDVRAERLVLSE